MPRDLEGFLRRSLRESERRCQERCPRLESKRLIDVSDLESPWRASTFRVIGLFGDGRNDQCCQIPAEENCTRGRLQRAHASKSRCSGLHRRIPSSLLLDHRWLAQHAPPRLRFRSAFVQCDLWPVQRIAWLEGLLTSKLSVCNVHKRKAARGSGFDPFCNPNCEVKPFPTPQSLFMGKSGAS